MSPSPETTDSASRLFKARAREQALILAALERHRNTGRGGVVLIGHDPSMIARPLFDSLESGTPPTTLIRLRCTEQAFPFEPFATLEERLREPSRSDSEGEGHSPGSLPPESGWPRPAPLPARADHLFHAQLDDSRRVGLRHVPPERLRQRAVALHEEFTLLLGDLQTPADRPARALLLEDLHLADDDTLLLLERLAAPPFALAGLIFATYHTTVKRPSLKRLTDRMRTLAPRNARFIHLELRPAAGDSLLATLEADLPGISNSGKVVAELNDLCHQDPLRVAQALQLLHASGDLHSEKRGWTIAKAPRDVIESVLPHAPRLSDDTAPEVRASLRRAAILGVRFTPGLLALLEGRDEIAVLETFQKGHDAGHFPLTPDRETFVFLNPELVATLESELLPPLRRAYARRAAQILDSSQTRCRTTGIAQIPPARIARLAELGGDLAMAFDAHLEAAAHAESLLAYASAAMHMNRALTIATAAGSEPSRAVFESTIGLARLLLCEPTPDNRSETGTNNEKEQRPRSLTLLNEAITLSEKMDLGIVERARVHALLGVALVKTPHSRTQGLEQLRRARTLLVLGGEDAEAWRYASAEAGLLFEIGEYQAALNLCEEVLNNSSDEEGAGFAKVIRAHLALSQGTVGRRSLSAAEATLRAQKLNEVEQRLEEAMEIFQSLGDKLGQAEALAAKAMVLLEAPTTRETKESDIAERHKQAVAAFEDTAALFYGLGALERAAMCHTRLAALLIRKEHPREAVAQLERAGHYRIAVGARNLDEIFNLLGRISSSHAERAHANLTTALEG